jgi:phosphomevalonate kinase
MIVASAPGKVVVSGEYAVLVGAPALIAAVDRRVECRLAPTSGEAWRFASRGFDATSTHPLGRLLHPTPLDGRDPARLCQCVLHELVAHGADPSRFPNGADVTIDSSALYENGAKLGLGSSAAVVVALTAALSRCSTLGSDPKVEHLDVMLAAHAKAQGGRGSGLDVAASCHGGLVRFRRVAGGVDVKPARLPDGVAYAVLSVGSATATATQLASFDEWRSGGVPDTLRALCDAAHRVADALSDPESFVRELRAFANCLAAMDDVAHLGIFSPPHRALSTMGSAAQVTYKPCGAGGGDIGIAFARRPRSLETFTERARAEGILPLSLELTQHGVEVRTES